MKRNNIRLVQAMGYFTFIFLVEEEDYGLIMNPIDEMFRSAEKIDNDNKKILPTGIRKYLNFKNKEKYMITEHNITERGRNIEVELEIKLIG